MEPEKETDTAPLVSVVMPTANQSRFIEEALDALANQLFQNFELIVVVDGADNTETIAILRQHRFMHDVANRYIVIKDNKGTAAALNAGFQMARGEYFTWVSSDNVMTVDWLETLVPYLDQWDAVYSSYRRISGKMAARWLPSASREMPAPHYDPANLVKREACYFGPSFLYAKTFHDDHRGAISHDYDWWLRFEEKTDQIVHCWEILCDYRVHSERVTVTKRHTYDAGKWQKEARKRRS